jgi:curli biogenesis system outer membrane secretion channel CsgG
MRPNSFIALALISASAVFAQSVDRKRIALYDFDYSTVKARVAQDIGPDYNIGKNVSAMLLSPLTSSGAYDVIDRSRMEHLFKEQNMRFSDRFDVSNAASYGRILGVDAIVTGTVDNVFIEYRQKVKGVMGVGRKHTEVRAVIDLTAQMISTETAQIFLAPTVTAEAVEELGSETGGTVYIPGASNRTGQQAGSSGISGSTTSSRNPGEQALRKAIREAVNKLAEQMVAKAPGLPRRLNIASVKSGNKLASKGAGTIPGDGQKPAAALKGLVMDVSGSTVFVDKGSQAGVVKGMRFEVRRYVRSVTSSSGKTMKLDKKIGVVEINEVSDEWSSGNYTGEAAKKDDAVIRVE